MKINLKKLRKKIRFRTIFLLTFLLISNSFAWFVYNTKVNNNITTSVKAWRIAFENNDDAIQYLEFNIKNIYPGMEDYNNQINITNEGETDAAIVYELEELKILDNTYTSIDYTQEELNNMIKNDFPFKINFDVNTDSLKANNGTGLFTINVSWPYESNNDELDTLWGNKSYDFKTNYPDDPGIVIKLKLTVSQIKD